MYINILLRRNVYIFLRECNSWKMSWIISPRFSSFLRYFNYRRTGKEATANCRTYILIFFSSGYMIFKLMVSFIFPLNNSGMKGTLNNISPSFTIFCRKKGKLLLVFWEPVFFLVPRRCILEFRKVNVLGTWALMVRGKPPPCNLA